MHNKQSSFSFQPGFELMTFDKQKIKTCNNIYLVKGTCGHPSFIDELTNEKCK